MLDPHQEKVDKTVGFDVLHEDNPSVRVEVSDELYLTDCGKVLKEMHLSWEKRNMNSFDANLKEYGVPGIISIYDTTTVPEKMLFQFSVERKGFEHPIIMNLLCIAENMKVIVYRPVVGGGETFVVAIGKPTSKFSVKKIWKSLPWWGNPLFPIPMAKKAEMTWGNEPVDYERYVYSRYRR